MKIGAGDQGGDPGLPGGLLDDVELVPAKVARLLVRSTSDQDPQFDFQVIGQVGEVKARGVESLRATV